MWIRIPKYIAVQLRISYYLVCKGRKADIVLFFVGGTGLLFPLLVAKLLGKKTIQIMAGESSKSAKDSYEGYLFGAGGFIMYHILSFLDQIAFTFLDKIVTYSPGVVSGLGLDKYSNKVIPKGARFVDTTLFQSTDCLIDRTNLVGFFGRLSPEKGVMNLIKAIPLILEQYGDIEFLIGGSGPLLPRIEEELVNNQCRSKVTLTGWISHERIPQYLRQMKLLILPSSSGEGLPNIILEAMASGTPVLATKVGTTPELITDGETGFLLEDNLPENIADSVVKVLRHPNLTHIINNARSCIEKNYTYESAIQRYKDILNSV